MAEIEGLVRALREGDDAAKAEAARVLGHLAYYDAANQIGDAADQVLIAEAGGVPLLVELLRDGSAPVNLVNLRAAGALCNLARNNDVKVQIAEAGGIAPLGDLLREGTRSARDSLAYDAAHYVAGALQNLARNNDGNAIAIAVAVGFEALVQLARRGRVNFEGRWVLDAGVPAKRKAALVVATLLRDSVPDSVPDEMKALIAPYL